MSSLQVTFRVLIALAVITLLGFAMGSFQVMSNEAVIVTRFGSPVATHLEPGLYAKLPWPIDTLHRIDRRTYFMDTRLSEALTQDKRNVILPVFVAWKVSDPLKFLEAVGNTESAHGKIDSVVTSARNALLGQYAFRDLVSLQTGSGQLAGFEQRLRDAVREATRETFGLTIEQVGVRRIALPEANTAFVFERMKAERGQYAARFRAEGRREADELRAKTDAERTVLLAEAQKYAEETRGKAEAEAAKIYSEAHARSPEFYQLVRELESLRKVAKDNTTLILDTETSPFNQLKAAPTVAR